MDVFTVFVLVVIVHPAHHEKMCQRTQQKQSNIEDRIYRYFEQKDCRQPDDGKQAAKQQDPEIALVHSRLSLSIPYERRSGDK
jgi:hypothetical protein